MDLPDEIEVALDEEANELVPETVRCHKDPKTFILAIGPQGVIVHPFLKWVYETRHSLISYGRFSGRAEASRIIKEVCQKKDEQS